MALGAAINMLRTAATSLTGASARRAGAALQSRGLQGVLSGGRIVGERIAQYAGNNKVMAAMIGVELARAGANIDFSMLESELGDELPKDVLQMMRSQATLTENLYETTGDGDSDTVAGIPMKEYRQAAVVHRMQKDTLKEGIRAAGGPRQWLALYRSLHQVEPFVVSEHMQEVGVE